MNVLKDINSTVLCINDLSLMLNWRKLDSVPIMHLHHPKSAVIGLMIKLVFRVKTRVVFTVHNDVTKQSIMNQVLMLVCYLASDIVTCNSEATQSSLDRSLFTHFLSKAKCLVVDNPVCIPANFTRRSQSEFDLIYVGRFVEQKNLKRLVLALGAISKKAIVRAVFIGDGPQLPEIKRLAAKQGAIIEFKGVVEHSEVFDYLAISRVFVSPSLWEGFGNTFSEALSCGCIVVASDIPALSRLKGHAVFVDPLSVESIESGINEALSMNISSLYCSGIKRSVTEYLKIYDAISGMENA